MDEIIYLEPDEEITSVVDKIKNAKAASLGLAVPRGATILQSVVNLRLIMREATALSKQIAIVTTDKIGRNLAAQVGLTVYSSVKEEKPVFTPPPPEHDNQEVIEIDDAPKQDEPIPDDLRVHHFQDTRPVIHWKPQHKPVFEPQVASAESSPKIRFESNKGPVAVKERREFDPKTKKLIWPIAGVLLVLAGISFYLLFPRAKAQVFMNSEDLNKTVVLTVTNQVQSASINQNIFPGELIEAFAENTEKFSTTGKKNLGGKATGTISFYNGLDSNAHKFSAGTKLLSNSKTFILKSTVTVPGATVQSLKVVPGTISAEVEAENAGEDYNIKAGKFVIVGLTTSQQAALYAESTKDLSGGFTREVQVVSQEDYDKAKDKLIKALDVTIGKDLQTKADNKKILEKAIVTGEPEIISSSGVDQEANEFEMKVRMRKQAMVFDFTSFTAFLTEILEKQVPSDKMVAIPSEADYGLIVDKTSYDTKEMNLTANVQAKISSRIDAEKIKTAIIGKSQAAAEDFIKSQDGVSKTVFEFRPAWLKRIPSISRNVTVEIRYLTE